MQKSAPSRTADLYAKRSEGPVSAHHVAMLRRFQIEAVARQGPSVTAPAQCISLADSLGIPAENRNQPRYDLHGRRPATRGDSLDGRGLEARHHHCTVNAAEGAVRLMIASIRLMGQSKSMRSIVDATQREQRHGLACSWCVNRDGAPD